MFSNLVKLHQFFFKKNKKENEDKNFINLNTMRLQFQNANRIRLRRLKETCQKMDLLVRLTAESASADSQVNELLNYQMMPKFTSKINQARFKTSWKIGSVADDQKQDPKLHFQHRGFTQPDETKSNDFLINDWAMCIPPKQGTTSWQRLLIAASQNKQVKEVHWNYGLYHILESLGSFMKRNYEEQKILKKNLTGIITPSKEMKLKAESKKIIKKEKILQKPKVSTSIAALNSLHEISENPVLNLNFESDSGVHSQANSQTETKDNWKNITNLAKIYQENSGRSTRNQLIRARTSYFELVKMNEYLDFHKALSRNRKSRSFTSSCDYSSIRLIRNRKQRRRNSFQNARSPLISKDKVPKSKTLDLNSIDEEDSSHQFINSTYDFNNNSTPIDSSDSVKYELDENDKNENFSSPCSTDHEEEVKCDEHRINLEKQLITLEWKYVAMCCDRISMLVVFILCLMSSGWFFSF